MMLDFQIGTCRYSVALEQLWKLDLPKAKKLLRLAYQHSAELEHQIDQALPNLVSAAQLEQMRAEAEYNMKYRKINPHDFDSELVEQAARNRNFRLQCDRLDARMKLRRTLKLQELWSNIKN